MFKISQSPSYYWTVHFSFPSEKGGFEKANFDCLFKRLTQTRINEIISMAGSGEITDAKIAQEIVQGWRGITDSNGEEVPFSQSALDQLLDVPMMATSISSSFIESLSDARRKN